MTPKDLFLQQRILIFSSRNPPPHFSSPPPPPPKKKLGWSSKTPTLAFNSQSPQLPASPASVLLLSSIIFIFSPGRLGPMVTCTLKLGISILNGGNVQVQQVRLHGSDIQLGLLFALCITPMFPSIYPFRGHTGAAFGLHSRKFDAFLFSSLRKCLIT